MYCTIMYILSIVPTLLQNEYCECANLILSHYPDQIEHLLAMVFSDKIPEAKMQQLLTYLGKNCTNLLSRVLSKLASNTCLAGMELLRYVVVASFPILIPSFSFRLIFFLMWEWGVAKNQTMHTHASCLSPGRIVCLCVCVCACVHT